MEVASIPPAVYRDLYDHQVEGVKWMQRLYDEHQGGILADDMGLGKTRQCGAFISAMLHSKSGSHALVVLPVSVIAVWQKEMACCKLPAGTCVKLYHGANKKKREDDLECVLRKGGVLLTTYDIVREHAYDLGGGAATQQGACARAGKKPFKWDVVFLDEGHTLKTGPKTAKYRALNTLPMRTCIAVTGTPIQNTLQEFHALLGLCSPGLLRAEHLGSFEEFELAFGSSIKRLHYRDTSPDTRQEAEDAAHRLRRIISAHVLRREKESLLSGHAHSLSSSVAGSSHSGGSGASNHLQKLPSKTDLVVWLRLSDMQEAVYTSFIDDPEVTEALDPSDCALSAITVLRNICNHPALLTKRALTEQVMKLAAQVPRGSTRTVTEDPDEVSEEVLKRCQLELLQGAGPDASCKVTFTLHLLDQLRGQKHRTLLFSQSIVMLDIFEAAFKAKGIKTCRINGTTKPGDRAVLVAKFQADASIPVFLLSSKAGGVGITLTAADRVVLLDPSWNPATDNQCVDRAYRIGQTREVVIYRLVTCGTVEEIIYSRQVFKSGLFKSGTTNDQHEAYFTEEELRHDKGGLFDITAAGFQTSAARERIVSLNKHHEKHYSPELQRHLQQLQALPVFAGVSDHGQLFSPAFNADRHQSDGGSATKQQLDTLPPLDQGHSQAPRASTSSASSVASCSPPSSIFSAASVSSTATSAGRGPAHPPSYKAPYSAHQGGVDAASAKPMPSAKAAAAASSASSASASIAITDITPAHWTLPGAALGSGVLQLDGNQSQDAALPGAALPAALRASNPTSRRPNSLLEASQPAVHRGRSIPAAALLAQIPLPE